ncbi:MULTISPECIES: GvpL/GvpF family gas vesicle protein [Burkholderia]|uniref:Gas vesicle protein GvpFL n=1 Tax=Burkholderia savannae TaxID=1637837 RepID=A0ABR5T3I8_9BURK|nr:MULTISPECIES: GvpL/GvpF family gas vesicle protein [Burkholderia]AOJ71121.1 gas vesicle protein GvpFL [Burkholderia savannae]AOK49516.1 gas vesicle protein GvpFL [Burkholderia sp. MSMB617WGS]KVG48811.1 gas vesicle protein GvpFL [Burkholderia sp. MSMB0265]KVG86271.1 gas vesicle protein GvpFL [Burkholderia sp. MSMB2040]KVG90549.1 gas vesicle protein GvpFL [Burkholderia sp. MSMB2041]
MNAALYLFCFARAERLAPAWATRPPGEPRLQLLRDGDLAAVLCDASRSEFAGADAERRLTDPAWIAGRVAIHAAVIEWTMRYSPVFPAQFGALFSSADRVIASMQSAHAHISRVLDLVDGKTEWAVKGWLDRRAATDSQAALLRAEEPEWAARATGTHYLRERQLQARAGHNLRGWLEQSVPPVSARLQRHAVQMCSRPSRASDSPNEIVANWAFLVRNRDVQAFRRQAKAVDAEFAARGLHFDFSGPWPPYSFCAPLAEETTWSG